jgi:hypothetical protein
MTDGLNPFPLACHYLKSQQNAPVSPAESMRACPRFATGEEPTQCSFFSSALRR